MTAPKVNHYVVGICELCRAGVPGDCNVPGCMFSLSPDSLRAHIKGLTVLPVTFEFNPSYSGVSG